MEHRITATLASDEAQVEIDIRLVDAWSKQGQASRVLWEHINIREKIPWHGKFLDEAWICAAARCGVHVGSALK